MIHLTILNIMQNYAETVINSAQTNPKIWAGILVMLFEIFVRLRPTKRNLSILDKLHTLVNFVLPNYSAKQSANDAGKIIKEKFKIK